MDNQKIAFRWAIEINKYDTYCKKFEYENKDNNHSDAYNLGLGWDINTPLSDGDQFCNLPSVGEFALGLYDPMEEKLIFALFQKYKEVIKNA